MVDRSKLRPLNKAELLAVEQTKSAVTRALEWADNMERVLDLEEHPDALKQFSPLWNVKYHLACAQKEIERGLKGNWLDA